MEILEECRLQIERDLARHPRDLELHHSLKTLRNVELRIRLLSRGGLRVIEGGRGNTNKEGT